MVGDRRYDVLEVVRPGKISPLDRDTIFAERRVRVLEHHGDGRDPEAKGFASCDWRLPSEDEVEIEAEVESVGIRGHRPNTNVVPSELVEIAIVPDVLFESVDGVGHRRDVRNSVVSRRTTESGSGKTGRLLPFESLVPPPAPRLGALSPSSTRKLSHDSSRRISREQNSRDAQSRAMRICLSVLGMPTLRSCSLATQTPRDRSLRMFWARRARQDTRRSTSAP